MTNDAFAPAQRVADALVWEGYVLYPYRASADKNRMRWQFGVLVPPTYADAHERARLTTEVVVTRATAAPLVSAQVRFLRAQRRQVEVERDGAFVAVDELARDGELWVSWDEAVDHTVSLHGESVVEIALPAESSEEAVAPDVRIVRTRAPLAGVARLSLTADGERLRVRADLENTTTFDSVGATRDTALGASLIAAHVLLRVDGGRFVSTLDPSDDAAEAVARCTNDGVFPVLIGDADAPLVLASPIILYDFPSVASASRGDMFDATEIDEILSLRVLTLTDAEKAAARATDPRAAAIVDRVDAFAPQDFDDLHAEMSDPDTDAILVHGQSVQRGSRVRLHPGKAAGRRTDAQDMFLVGMEASVAGVFTDLEGERYVAVIVDGDAAHGLRAEVGRFRYFYPDEIVPL